MNKDAEIDRLKAIVADAHETLEAVEWSGKWTNRQGVEFPACPFCSADKSGGIHSGDCRVFLAKERTKP